MTEPAKITLTFPAKPEYLVLSRLALSGIARAYPVDPDVLADLKLALTEACSNAVKHAYHGTNEPVSVSFSVNGGTLEVVVEDHGSGIDVPESGVWEMPSEPDHGMGMAIIQTVMDGLEVTKGENGQGTVVRMTKQLDLVG